MFQQFDANHKPTRLRQSGTGAMQSGIGFFLGPHQTQTVESLG